jgi:hypothetical protein
VFTQSSKKLESIVGQLIWGGTVERVVGDGSLADVAEPPWGVIGVGDLPTV